MYAAKGLSGQRPRIRAERHDHGSDGLRDQVVRVPEHSAADHREQHAALPECYRAQQGSPDAPLNEPSPATGEPA